MPTTSRPTTRTHLCAARGCDDRVPLHRLMCRRHWRRVPRQLRQRIWGAYRPGQELDHEIRGEYVRLVRLAISEVAKREMATP